MGYVVVRTKSDNGPIDEGKIVMSDLDHFRASVSLHLMIAGSDYELDRKYLR